MKHRLIPLAKAVPKVFLQRRRNRRIPEPRMPARIGPESVVNVPLSSRNAITVALLRRLAVRRRRSINNHRLRMRAPGNQCNRQKHERQTQNLLHHDFPFVLRGLRSLGKGIRHRPFVLPSMGTDSSRSWLLVLCRAELEPAIGKSLGATSRTARLRSPFRTCLPRPVLPDPLRSARLRCHEHNFHAVL
jgi:hypothetical protein